MIEGQLPAGRGEPRTRLWDKQWRLIWDSATATTPCYQHVATEVRATIDQDGDRWVGLFCRCPEGIRRYRLPTRRELEALIAWPEPVFGEMPRDQ